MVHRLPVFVRLRPSSKRLLARYGAVWRKGDEIILRDIRGASKP